MIGWLAWAGLAVAHSGGEAPAAKVVTVHLSGTQLDVRWDIATPLGFGAVESAELGSGLLIDVDGHTTTPPWQIEPEGPGARHRLSVTVPAPTQSFTVIDGTLLDHPAWTSARVSVDAGWVIEAAPPWLEPTERGLLDRTGQVRPSEAVRETRWTVRPSTPLERLALVFAGERTGADVGPPKTGGVVALLVALATFLGFALRRAVQRRAASVGRT